jgi:hypothetical protein
MLCACMHACSPSQDSRRPQQVGACSGLRHHCYGFLGDSCALSASGKGVDGLHESMAVSKPEAPWQRTARPLMRVAAAGSIASPLHLMSSGDRPWRLSSRRLRRSMAGFTYECVLHTVCACKTTRAPASALRPPLDRSPQLCVSCGVRAHCTLRDETLTLHCIRPYTVTVHCVASVVTQLL